MFTLISFALYFLPAILAYHRRHPSAGAILILNLLLGWTLIGWVAALVWSLRERGPVYLLQPAVPGGYCTHCGTPLGAAYACSRCGARLCA